MPRGRLASWVATGLTATFLVAVSPGRPSASASAQAPAPEPEPATVDVVIRSFDGTPINAHFFPASGLDSGQRAASILLAHGYGEAGPADRDGPRLAGAPRVRSLVDAGFNVMTWDARGMGASGGTARFDDPTVEVKDVEALIDWLARRPDVLLDAPHDPRVGMTGASYGGIIQYSTAALDRRVDAIAPSYTGYSLANTMLSQNGKFKEGWALLLAAVGIGTIPPGLLSPLGPQLHGLDAQSTSGLAASTLAGVLTPAFRRYLDERSPDGFLGRIRVPTLISGGTSDTLFPLINAVSDYRALRRRGVPVEMMWNCEGHSRCPASTGPLEAHFDGTQIRWFRRWLLRDGSVGTGPGFTWIADNETRYRSAAAYPPRTRGYLRGTGAGTLLLTPAGPLQGGGMPELGAEPAAGAVDVGIHAPRRAGNVLGFPGLRLLYRGTGLPASSWIYAQVVDRRTHRVVGAQVTPVPVLLDGRPHTAVLHLNAIASRATPGSHYVLQLIPGSLIYGLQRSIGSVQVIRASIRLPFS